MCECTLSLSFAPIGWRELETEGRFEKGGDCEGVSYCYPLTDLEVASLLNTWRVQLKLYLNLFNNNLTDQKVGNILEHVRIQLNFYF